MNAPVRLDLMITKGIVQLITIEQGLLNRKHPPKNHAWLLLGGTIAHATGTSSVLGFGKTGFTVLTSTVDTAVANGVYDIFNTVAAVAQAQRPNFLIVTDDMFVQLDGDATATATIEVLEWQCQ